MEINVRFFRNGPHGIPHPLDESKMETRNNDKVESKPSHKTPFPQPLITRHSYRQNVPQPPLRNIFRKIRRSRRNARLNVLPHIREAAVKNRSTIASKSVPKSASVQGVQSASNKRKINDHSDSEDTLKKLKLAMPNNSSEDELVKTAAVVSETMASPVKHLIPRKENDKSHVQRTPAIRIKYKSPAGRGRIVKIPSKAHSKCEQNTFEKKEKTDQFNQKKSKPKQLEKRFDKAQEILFSNVLPSKHIPHSDKAVMKHPRLKLLKRITNVTVKRIENGSMDGVGHKDDYSMMVFVEKDSQSGEINKKSASGCTKNNLKPKLPRFVKSGEINKKSASDCTKNNFKPKLRRFVEKDSQCGQINKLSVHTCTKNDTKPNSPKPVKRKSVKQNNGFAPTIEKRHLRIILKPLDSASDFDAANTTVKEQYFPNIGDGKFSSKNPTSPNSKKITSSKKASSPLSHTIYVTTCRDCSGTIFTQGDIVWSKLTGYPWWPSQIIKLIVTKTDGAILQQEAMVGWFCSSTTSIISLSLVLPFEKSFDIR